jgi:gamma-glutamylcyclotransferase (GGCT)/AIG2-like uncharacterized protein YtfP
LSNVGVNKPRRMDRSIMGADQSANRIDQAGCRMAVYGSLAPGESNHHVLAAIRGVWRAGWVEGRLHPPGRGSTGRYPGLIWRPGGDRIPVQVLESPDLPAHWARLDAFEGAHYRRIVVPVFDVVGVVGPLEANIYVLARSTT